MPQLLHRVQAHVGAGVAAAGIGARHLQEGAVGPLAAHLVEDAGLGEHDVGIGFGGGGALQQAAGGADEVGQIQQMLLAFGVGDHLGPGMLLLQLQQGLLAEGFMHQTTAWPEGEVAAALACHPAAQVLIRRKQNRPVGGQLLHQRHRIAARADQIALRLHRRRTIDVAHHDVFGVGGAEGGEGVGGARIGQAAAGVEIGQENRFARVEDFCGLRHEMDAAEHDHLGLGAGGAARELQRVADEVGDVLDRILLVVVGQDHGVAARCQLPDRVRQIGASWGPNGRRDGRREGRLREHQPCHRLRHRSCRIRSP